MQKIILFFIIMAMLFGCSKPESNNVLVESIMQQITNNIYIQNMTTEYLTNPKTAERYGISSNSVSQGIVCYSEDLNSSDEIIIVKAANKENIEEIERAFSAEITGLSDAWSENKEETEKIDHSLIKTKGEYIILAVSNNTDKIEEIFDANIFS